MFPTISTASLLSKFPCASTIISSSSDLRPPFSLSLRFPNPPLCSLASKISNDQVTISLSDGSDSDSFGLFDDNDEIEDDPEDDVLLPFAKMNQWRKNKPRGFGDGKTYDTSIEDKLLDEMVQSRRAQALNIANLKSANSRGKPSVTQVSKDEKSPSVGIRVRISNLPKKKNIHRDLNTAFKDVRGIVSIVPAVSGSKKTKDPICKGLAFVDFNSQKNADMFVEQFSSKMVEFGKIQKQIKCHHVKEPSFETSEVEIVESFSVEFEEIIYDESDAIDVGIKDVIDVEPLDSQSAEKTIRQRFDGSKMVDDKCKKKIFGGKNAKERTNGKLQKLDIPGSAKRLKVRDKALLTGVFTKYASQASNP